MITDILTYIEAYDNVRAATGLSKFELPDATLGLLLYRLHLNTALTNITGVYGASPEERNLLTIFGELDTADELYPLVQQFAIYATADCALSPAGLRAYKQQGDGKATLGRFSPESTYLGTRQNVKSELTQVLAKISALLGKTASSIQPLRVVAPDVDLVVGEDGA